MKRICRVGIFLVVIGGPACQPQTTTDGPEEASEGSTSGESEGSGSIDEGSAGEGVAAADEEIPNPATCELVELEGGAVTCNEGCVLVKGAPLVGEPPCARQGIRWEVAIGCLAPPLEVREMRTCYENSDGHAVVSALHYGDMSAFGWTTCADDDPRRLVESCPSTPEDQIPVFAEGSGATQ